MSQDIVRYAVDADGIATLTIDYPGKSMNVIDQAFMDRLDAAIARLVADPAVKGAILTSGKDAFVADAWIPTDAVRGELAESWEWKDNPMRLEVKLRKGIRFPEKPGVMKSRELVADDVVFSYKRMDASPKKIPTTCFLLTPSFTWMWMWACCPFTPCIWSMVWTP